MGKNQKRLAKDDKTLHAVNKNLPNCLLGKSGTCSHKIKCAKIERQFIVK